MYSCGFKSRDSSRMKRTRSSTSGGSLTAASGRPAFMASPALCSALRLSSHAGSHVPELRHLSADQRDRSSFCGISPEVPEASDERSRPRLRLANLTSRAAAQVGAGPSCSSYALHFSILREQKLYPKGAKTPQRAACAFLRIAWCGHAKAPGKRDPRRCDLPRAMIGRKRETRVARPLDLLCY